MSGLAPLKKRKQNTPEGRKIKCTFAGQQKKSAHLCFISLSSLSPSERIFEDHENLVENLLNWTRDSHNKLMFIERIEKYALFKNPQVTFPVGMQVGRGGIIVLMPSVATPHSAYKRLKSICCTCKRIVYACAVAARCAERANKAMCLRRSVRSRSKALKRVKVNNLLDIRRGEPLTLHSLPSTAGFLFFPSSTNCSSQSSPELFAGEEGDV